MQTLKKAAQTIDLKPGKPAKVTPKTRQALAVATRPTGPVVVNAAASMLQIVAKAAADPRCQPDKMRAILDMQKEIMAEEARLAFLAAFGRLQNELPEIKADGKIEIPAKEGSNKRAQVTPYATFQNIMQTVKPLLEKHEFTLSFATEPTADHSRIIVKGFLAHARGHERVTAFPLPAEVSGSKNNVQGWGSSMSYGKRYATIALLNIISFAKEDRDLDGANPVVAITQKQADDLRDLIETVGANKPKFLNHFGIATVEELPAKDLPTAIQMLNQRGRA